MNLKNVRWKQRFENFEKAFIQLTEAVERIDELSDLGIRDIGIRDTVPVT